MIFRAFIRSTHRAAFRRGRWAKVDAVVMMIPEGLGERPCYRVIYSDGETDFLPVYDPEAAYEFTSKTPEGWPG